MGQAQLSPKNAEGTSKKVIKIESSSLEKKGGVGFKKGGGKRKPNY